MMGFIATIFLIVMSFNATAFKIMVISDLNGSYGSTTYNSNVKNAVEKIISKKPDLVLSTGDMVAGQKAGLDYQKMWESFHRHVTTPLKNSGIPFAITVGNHDGSAYPAFKLERKIFIDEWKKNISNLNFLDDSNYPLYYSFDMEGAFFASLDSTKLGLLDFTQISWLENQLKENIEKKIKIIFTHVPLFHFSQMNLSESFFDEHLFNLLKKYKVTMYLTGHHHAYFPGFYEGIHFVSQACLGSGARALNGTNRITEGLTQIHIETNKIDVHSLLPPDFSKVENIKNLPQSIKSGQHIIKAQETSNLTY